MDYYLDQTIAFIERNQVWAPWIMLIFAAAETTAFLSILVPSTAIMVAVGAMAATGAIDFFPLWVGASAGAIIGSFFSYWLGKRYGNAILRQKPMCNHPEWIEKANSLFLRWGPVTIFGGHFAAILRPVVFLMAGISHMPLLRFSFYNILGCLTWAWVVPKFGEVGGHAVKWVWQSLFG